MNAITWNTDVSAPCCPGEILAEDGRSILVQTDRDYPSVAQSFGWSLRNVQWELCDCGEPLDWPITPQAGDPIGTDGICDCGKRYPQCDHNGTDGTVDCEDCGLTATDFISAAGEWLAGNDGLTADDPGYFDGYVCRVTPPERMKR